jgi:hypothetical protein
MAWLEGICWYGIDCVSASITLVLVEFGKAECQRRVVHARVCVQDQKVLSSMHCRPMPDAARPSIGTWPSMGFLDPRLRDRRMESRF